MPTKSKSAKRKQVKPKSPLDASEDLPWYTSQPGLPVTAVKADGRPITLRRKRRGMTASRTKQLVGIMRAEHERALRSLGIPLKSALVHA